MDSDTDDFYNEFAEEWCENDAWQWEVGCCFPDNCCMPGVHFKGECHTAEMLEAEEKAAVEDKP